MFKADTSPGACAFSSAGSWLVLACSVGSRLSGLQTQHRSQGLQMYTVNQQTTLRVEGGRDGPEAEGNIGQGQGSRGQMHGNSCWRVGSGAELTGMG